MTLYLPIGPPACGKSTLANLLVEGGWLDADAVVSPDHYRRVLTGDVGDQTFNSAVFSICDRIAHIRLSHSLDVWYDATNLTGTYSTVVVAAMSRNQPVVCIVFDTSDEECGRRNALREQPVPDDVMTTMFERRAQMRIRDLPGYVVFDQEFAFKTVYSHPMPPA